MTKHPNTSRVFQIALVALVLAGAALPFSKVVNAQSETAKNQSHQTTGWLDPRGIDGTLAITPSSPSGQALDWLTRQAESNELHQILVIASGPIPLDQPAGELINTWLDNDDVELKTNVNLGGLDQGSESTDSFEVLSFAELPEAIQQTELLWILSPSSSDIERDSENPSLIETLLNDAQVHDAMRQFLNEGKLMMSSGAPPSALLAASSDALPISLELFPYLLIEQTANSDLDNESISNTLKQQPHLVGLQMTKAAEFVIRGREIRSLGDGAISIHLAETDHKSKQEFDLVAERVMDLTSLRRAARDRTEARFPSDPANTPHVPSGTLIIIGGGGMPSGIVEQFVELAGGEEASIVVLPTAMPDPVSEQDRIADAFRRAGAKSVKVLTGRTPEKVESEEYLQAFEEATGIWFGGGRQWRFVDAYENTKVVPLMHAVLDKGGVIMGSSAGASIQAEYLARGTPIGNTSIYADGYERGLGFLPGVAVDQHFTQRNRFNDLRSLIDRYPQLLGIGIDEATAIIVEDSTAKVVGAGGTHFLDAKKRGEEDELRFESVYAGGTYNLANREIIEVGTKPEPRPRRRSTVRPPRPPITQQERALRFANRIFERLDKNADLFIDEQEQAGSRMISTEADTNKDGKISKQELQDWVVGQINRDDK